MFKYLSLIFIFAATGLACWQLIPVIMDKFYGLQVRGVAVQKGRLGEMFLDINPQKLFFINVLSPLLVGTISFLVTREVIFAGMGAVAGFLIPALVVKNMVRARKAKFNNQISEGLMILSSCLKGGYSLLQSIESLVEELPAPISQEFGLILKENKMGIALEESFESLNKRMPSEELNLLTTAILVARETGGDITQLFAKLINTIRVKTKLRDNVSTLSLQGKIQGVVMSLLPIAFAMMVVSFNPNYFDIMLNNPTGRALLVYAAFSEIFGVFLIRIFSRVNV